MTTSEIESLVRWTKPKEVMTKNGPRILRTYKPRENDDPIWEVWGERQNDLKPLGLSMSKDPYTDDWRLCWWQKLAPEIIQERNERIELSRSLDSDIEIPCPEGCEFRPFQKAGVNYILRAFKNNGVLLGDQAGVGKTPQAIGVINAIPEISRVLIICPLTIKANWERELRKWLSRKMTIGHANANYFPKTDIVLMHYNVVHRFPTATGNYWDLIICDEAHKIKNRKTLCTKYIVGYRPTKNEIAKAEKLNKPIPQPVSAIPARRKLMMSGTPFENKPSELWPIISYIAPDLFGSKSAFERRYCSGQMTEYGWSADGAANGDEMSEKLRASCMIRRLKKDVLKELPPKTRIVVEMETGGLEHAIANEQKAWKQNQPDLEETEVALELAKACDDESQFKNAVASLRNKMQLIFKEISKVRHQTTMAKMPKMIEMLKDELEEVQKIIVFGHHLDALHMAADEFPGECVLITGETPPIDRDKLVQQFQNDPRCRLFFGSIRATGEGINLTASSHVIFLENDWTASKMSQASDRSHRQGQKDNVTVKYYILPGTIDAHMIQTWIRKEEILEKSLDSERAEIESEVTLLPKTEKLATRTELERDAVTITREMRQGIHAALRSLAMNCDGAKMIDSQGFNKFDARIGQSLAAMESLTPKCAALGKKLCIKYQRQLSPETLKQCGINL